MDVAELGAFLRSRRDRIRPADVGLPTGPRRRVPGLRRDEVAQLAGASVEYYIELERGAGSQPSGPMLAALAGALRLDRSERDHLYHLAGRPVPAGGPAAGSVDPGLLDLLGRLDGIPAQIVSDLHVTLAQNRSADVLLGERTPVSFLYRWFTGDPVARSLYPEADHEAHSAWLAADLRAAVARRRGDGQDAADLVDELLARSPEFAAHWARHDVLACRQERKQVFHPVTGLVEVICFNLFSEDGRQRLIWSTPAPG